MVVRLTIRQLALSDVGGPLQVCGWREWMEVVNFGANLSLKLVRLVRGINMIT